MSARSRTPAVPGGFAHRLVVVARWPWLLARVAWAYTWRITPIHRSEVDGDVTDLPAPVPAELRAGLHAVEDGVGALLHRRYSVRIVGATRGPQEVIESFAGEPNRHAPGVALFEKIRGTWSELRVGDEFLIRMPGPWNGPVRVVGRSRTSFRLGTMRGHLEAGSIEFAVRAEGDATVISIESWARPGDRLSRLLYDRLRLAKEIQLNLWIETLLALATAAGGRLSGGLRVRTRRIPQFQLPVTATEARNDG